MMDKCEVPSFGGRINVSLSSPLITLPFKCRGLKVRQLHPVTSALKCCQTPCPPLPFFQVNNIQDWSSVSHIRQAGISIAWDNRMKMRFWCVPSATEVESPKLPPRRDAFLLHSPPPPPRLSKEEKVARGVISSRSKQRKKKRSQPRKTRRPTLTLASGPQATSSPRLCSKDKASAGTRPSGKSSKSLKVTCEKSASLSDISQAVNLPPNFHHRREQSDFVLPKEAETLILHPGKSRSREKKHHPTGTRFKSKGKRRTGLVEHFQFKARQTSSTDQTKTHPRFLLS